MLVMVFALKRGAGAWLAHWLCSGVVQYSTCHAVEQGVGYGVNRGCERVASGKWRVVVSSEQQVVIASVVMVHWVL